MTAPPVDRAAGNRVLLCAPNNPMMVASWFGVIKAGGIAVAAMPLLRAKELSTIADIAQISHALCDDALRAERPAGFRAVESHIAQHQPVGSERQVCRVG